MNKSPALRSPHRWLHRSTFGSSIRLGAPTALLVTVLAALLPGLGCSKMAESTAHAGAMPRGAMPDAATIDITAASPAPDYRSDGSYSFDQGSVDGEMPGAGTALIASRARNEIGKSREYVPPARDKVGEPSTTKKAADAKAAKDAKDDEQPDHGRQIIYVAGVQISVYDLENAIATVEAMPERFGGWVHMRNQSQVVLRLPAARLEPAMAQLAELGVVEARTLQAQDVTAEYVDLESRIKVLRETQTQLLALLAQAKTVEEALHVRAALDQVTLDLEVALGRMRQLSDLIAFSTLTVTLVERGPLDNIPTSNDPFRWVDSLGVEATEWR